MVPRLGGELQAVGSSAQGLQRYVLQFGQLAIIQAHHPPQLGGAQRQPPLVAMPDQTTLLLVQLRQQLREGRPLRVLLIGSLLLDGRFWAMLFAVLAIDAGMSGAHARAPAAAFREGAPLGAAEPRTT